MKSPVVLDRAGGLIPLIEAILPGWPFTISTGPSAEMPCMILRAEAGAYLCETPQGQGEPRQWDGVNAICELVVELAWEQIRSNPSWMCLHCAAVDMNGRLVLFPDGRRAGKSTLTAVLASRGYRVFTDDFLPVHVDDDGFLVGRANGILPRIRVPPPAAFGESLKNWVARNPGPQNRQYKYLNIESLASRGATAPIGAVIALNRGDGVDCRLDGMTRQETLDKIVSQNFARTLHSGRILQAANGVTETADLFRLDYSSAETAADLLEDRFQTWATPTRAFRSARAQGADAVDLSLLATDQPALVEGLDYARARDVTEVQVEDALYLSDASGLGVHRLNAGSQSIWRLFDEPTSLPEITELLTTAFPEISRDQIESDSRDTMREFVRKRLIVPAMSTGRSVS